MLASTHPSPEPKRISTGSAVFAQLTSQCCRACQKIAPSQGRSVPPSNTWFLASTRLSIPNGISISSAVFAQCPYTLQWAAPSPPLKIALPMGRLRYPSNTWSLSLGPPECSTQAASRSVQPFLHGSLLRQTNRQTDRQTTLLGR